ncbi:hypothetical protein [Paenibacillus sp.]|nr:hypothetical protein [Paenibacillus sp.]
MTKLQKVLLLRTSHFWCDLGQVVLKYVHGHNFKIETVIIFVKQ